MRTSSSPDSITVFPLGTIRSRSLWMVVTMTLRGQSRLAKGLSGQRRSGVDQYPVTLSPSDGHSLKAGEKSDPIAPDDIRGGDCPHDFTFSIKDRHPVIDCCDHGAQRSTGSSALRACPLPSEQ